MGLYVHVFSLICHLWSLTHGPLFELHWLYYISSTELRWDYLWMGVVSCLRKKVGYIMNFEPAFQKATHKYEQAVVCTPSP